MDCSGNRSECVESLQEMELAKKEVQDKVDEKFMLSEEAEAYIEKYLQG